MELPKAFYIKYQNLLKDEASDFFDALTKGQVTKGYRVNPLKPNFYAMIEKYAPRNKVAAPYAPNAYLGSVGGRTLLHQAGYVYSQEPSAMLVATATDCQPGEKVLDLCAAPGGKSTQLATQLKGEGLLVANEIFPKRAKILAENIERWGVSNAIVTNHAPAELVKNFSGFFDRIVVDAPCSGEGMFRKDPVALSEWQEQTPLKCAKRQKEILTAAVKMLKTGGTLVYSTCTFAPEENEEIISWLLKEYPFTIVPIPQAQTNVSSGRPEWGDGNPALAKAVRLWPHLNQGEGHFVAKLIFQGENTVAKPKKKHKKVGLTKEVSSLVADFTHKFPQPENTTIQLFGDHIWAAPKNAPDLTGIKVLRNGVELGVVKKRRIEPSFNLAMAVTDKTLPDFPTLQINYGDWLHYVAGETFTKPGNDSWVLLCVDAIPVGFGKQVQGLVKNFYPKGLRFKGEPAPEERE